MKTDLLIKRFTALDSTNHYAAALLGENLPHDGTLIVAQEQTSGRGLERNVWESEPGKNLTFSLIKYPHFLMPELQFYLNIVTCLAIFELVNDALPKKRVFIKWPNDIYIDHKKISGILINNQISGSTLQSSIIGVGININQMQFYSDAPNPVSLRQLTGIEYDLDICLQQFISAFEKYYNILENNELNSLLDLYLKNMYLFGLRKEYVIRGGLVYGSIIGIDEYGQLQIETDDRIYSCQLKEVQFPLLVSS